MPCIRFSKIVLGMVGYSLPVIDPRSGVMACMKFWTVSCSV